MGYAAAPANKFYFNSADGTLAETNHNSVLPNGTYSFTFDYVPPEDPNSTSGGTMSSTVSNGTYSYHYTRDPLENAPWFFDGFSLDRFGFVQRNRGGGGNTDPYFLTISNFTYTGGTAVAGVPGDYNNNGTVDAADYVAWRKGSTLANEVDNPGTVNLADYTEWRARFGNPAGSGSGLGAGAVPEPASALLALLAGLVTVASWRCRSWS